MMLLAARGLARLVALALTTTLAAAGLAIAVFSIQGGSAELSLPGLAGHLHLDDLDASVGTFLADLQAAGPTATVAALAGAGTVLLGLLLLAGVLGRRRERLVVMRRDDEGTLAARPRAVAHAAMALAEQSRYALRAKARTRTRRRGAGGRLRITVYRARGTDEAEAARAGHDRVRALAEAFALRLRVSSRVPRRAPSGS